MARPVARFDFTTAGLSVKFTDSSFGIPTSWAWDFGFSTGGPPPVSSTSTEKNPEVAFPNPGIYKVTLIATNADGPSEVFQLDLVIDLVPTLNLTIANMVKCGTPDGLAVDTLCFANSIKTWQLYLQPFMGIDDADVFNEVKWPPLANVLISKLIIYDNIMTAAKSSMSSQYVAMRMSSSNNTPTSTTTQVADYTYDILFSELSTDIVVNLLLINGVEHSNNVPTDLAGLITWMNSLGFGTFILDSNQIKVLGSNNFISTFNVTTSNGASNGAFTLSNIRVVAINSINQVSTPGMPSGPLKYIETGPSKTEWYDSSAFWSSMFSSKGNSKSLTETLIEELCMWASRMGVRLPMCPQSNTQGFNIRISGKSPNSNNCLSKFLNYGLPNKPASMG